MNLPDILSLTDVKLRIHEALAEDLGPKKLDVTTFSLVGKECQATANLIARTDCVLAGGPVARAVFHEVDRTLSVSTKAADGSVLSAGDVILTITGSARSILVAERIALNFIQRMTGIATMTRKYVEEANNPGVAILDTRKTTPTLRSFEKYSVLCGGGTNHRKGLFDRAMLKDNHLAYWAENHDSGICGAIRAVRDKFPECLVELEVDTIDQLREALPAKPDWVLLDNMPPLELRECVKLCNGISKTEASGGITLKTIREVAKTGVDAISVGALTHSSPSVDLALDWA